MAYCLLAQCNAAVGADGSFAFGDVGIGQGFDVACDDAGFVAAGADAALLDEGVDLSVDERTVCGEDADRDDGCVTECAGEAHSVWRAEVAQAVSDELPVVHFDAACHVRTMSVDYRCAVVDAEMREAAEVAPVLAEIGLGTIGKMPLVASLRSPGERDTDDVGMILQRIQHRLDLSEIGVLQRFLVMSESAESPADTAPLHDCPFPPAG